MGPSARILVVGATSFIGTSVARLLFESGYSVTGLARSDEAAAVLSARGLTVLRAGIGAVATASDGLKRFDACLWLSPLPLTEERGALEPLLEAMTDSGKAFIFTSGTAVLGIPSPLGEWDERSFAEGDAFEPSPRLARRVETEQFVRAQADRGVRAMVVRPPMVWGHGGSRQIPWLFNTVSRSGAACYVGRGLNVYSHVHVDDLAQLFQAAIARGRPGALYHAVAGEADFRQIAQAVADAMACPSRSVTVEAMAAMVGRSETEIGLAMNSRSRCPRSRDELGWAPKYVDLIEDVRHGSYRLRYGLT